MLNRQAPKPGIRKVRTYINPFIIWVCIDRSHQAEKKLKILLNTRVINLA